MSAPDPTIPGAVHADPAHKNRNEPDWRFAMYDRAAGIVKYVSRGTQREAEEARAKIVLGVTECESCPALHHVNPDGSYWCTSEG